VQVYSQCGAGGVRGAVFRDIELNTNKQVNNSVRAICAKT